MSHNRHHISPKPGLSTPYQYSFNGMERQDELAGVGNNYNTMYRVYDTRLGRWFSTDPMMRKYASMSPYLFSMNNPSFFNDPEGDDPITGLGEAVGAFAVTAGLDFLTSYLIKGQTAKEAFDGIDWMDASVDAGVAYATSFIFSGAGSLKTVKKLGTSKIGRIMMTTVESMTATIVADYYKGDLSLTGTGGELDFEKLDSEYLTATFFNSLLSAMVSEGFADRAEQLQKELKESGIDLMKYSKRLYNQVAKDAKGSTTHSTNRIKQELGSASQTVVNSIKSGAQQQVIESAGESVIENVVEEVVK